MATPKTPAKTTALGTALAVVRTATGLANNASNALKVAQSIGSTIRATREVQQITLSDLAKRAGVSKSVVSRIEAGLTSPTAVMLAKLAEGMTVSLSTLLRGELGPPDVSLQILGHLPPIPAPEGLGQHGAGRFTQLQPLPKQTEMRPIHTVVLQHVDQGPAHRIDVADVP